MKKFKRLFQAFMILGLCFAALSIGAIYAAIFVWKNPATAEVNIPGGAPVVRIAQQLASAGVIRVPSAFTLWARVTGHQGDLKSGLYQFAAGLTLDQVLNKIVRGEVMAFDFTIIEGWNLRDIAAALEKNPNVRDKNIAEDFLKLSRDPSFMSELGVMDCPSLEGYVFPDTYKLVYSASAADVLRQAVQHFRQKYTQAMAQRAAELGFTECQVLTLASIVEKETGVAEERPLIAAVFYNRLKLRMPLQTDPTVIYGLPYFDGNLRKADLSNPHPYNTYVHLGLPPGPIASPGLASIQAVLHPAQSDALYFVSRNDGTHVFSTSLAEHTRAVMQYQLRGGQRGPSGQ